MNPIINISSILNCFCSSTHVVGVARLQVWLSLTVLCFHLSQNCPCPAWRRIDSTGDEVSVRRKEKGALHQVEALGAHGEVTVLNLNTVYLSSFV
jgi:hypothetical protein